MIKVQIVKMVGKKQGFNVCLLVNNNIVCWYEDVTDYKVFNEDNADLKKFVLLTGKKGNLIATINEIEVLQIF